MIKNHRMLAVAALLLGGCAGGTGSSAATDGSGNGNGDGDGGTNGPPKLVLRATDSPFVHDLVEQATIEVDRITIHHEAQGDGDPIVLYEGDPIPMVLSSLVDGVTQFLGEHELEPGTYRQLRMRVARADLTLVNGNAYSTEDGTIHLSSQGTSGFKVFIDPPLVLDQGLTAGLLLDFDLPKTFLPIPANDPLDANRFNLHPVIHAAHLEATGGIQGTVGQDDGLGGSTLVEGATVYVLPPGVADPADSIASTATGADGHYTVLGLEEGVYDVLAVKDGLEASATGISVIPGPAVVVDLLLPPPPAGSIEGTATQDDGTGVFAPVAGAEVHVVAPGVTDPAMAFFSAVSAVDGTYALPEVPPGTYDVLGVLGSHETSALGVVVLSGESTTVDLAFEADRVGGIAGTVSQDDGSGTLVPVPGADVHVLPPGVGDPAQALASTVTAADGTYAFDGLAPGTYDVLAALGVLQGASQGVAVVADTTATVDLVIQ